MPDAGENIPEGFAPAGFSPGFLDLSGPYYLKQGQNGPIIGCRITDRHMNYVGIAHGGVLATLADVALSYLVYSSEEFGLPVSTVSMATNFLSSARLGDWVEATGSIDRLGKSLAYTNGVICAENRTLMTMSGVYHIISPKRGGVNAPTSN